MRLRLKITCIFLFPFHFTHQLNQHFFLYLSLLILFLYTPLHFNNMHNKKALFFLLTFPTTNTYPSKKSNSKITTIPSSSSKTNLHSLFFFQKNSPYFPQTFLLTYFFNFALPLISQNFFFTKKKLIHFVH